MFNRLYWFLSMYWVASYNISNCGLFQCWKLGVIFLSVTLDSLWFNFGDLSGVTSDFSKVFGIGSNLLLWGGGQKSAELSMLSQMS